jgi:hypothetical protein
LRIGEGIVRHWRNRVEEKLPLDEESKIQRDPSKQVAGEVPMRRSGGRQRWGGGERESRVERLGNSPAHPESLCF